jgi:hypothetical protein
MRNYCDERQAGQAMLLVGHIPLVGLLDVAHFHFSGLRGLFVPFRFPNRDATFSYSCIIVKRMI